MCMVEPEDGQSKLSYMPEKARLSYRIDGRRDARGVITTRMC